MEVNYTIFKSDVNYGITFYNSHQARVISLTGRMFIVEGMIQVPGEEGMENIHKSNNEKVRTLIDVVNEANRKGTLDFAQLGRILRL